MQIAKNALDEISPRALEVILEHVGAFGPIKLPVGSILQDKKYSNVSSLSQIPCRSTRAQLQNMPRRSINWQASFPEYRR